MMGFEYIKSELVRIRKIYFRTVRDTLTWLLLASLVLWIIAKAFGWINTVKAIEIYPFAGTVLLVIELFQRFVVVETKLTTIDDGFKLLRSDVKDGLSEIKKELGGIKNELHQHDIRLIKLEAKAV